MDHVAVYRRVQRFTAEFIETASLCRHAPDSHWFVNATYAKVFRPVDLSVPGD